MNQLNTKLNDLRTYPENKIDTIMFFKYRVSNQMNAVNAKWSNLHIKTDNMEIATPRYKKTLLYLF